MSGFSAELDPAGLLEALARRVAVLMADLIEERVERRRWLVGLEGLGTYLGCSPRLARELRAKGLPGRKIGKHLYFNVREIDEFIDREGSIE